MTRSVEEGAGARVQKARYSVNSTGQNISRGQRRCSLGAKRLWLWSVGTINYGVRVVSGTEWGYLAANSAVLSEWLPKAHYVGMSVVNTARIPMPMRDVPNDEQGSCRDHGKIRSRNSYHSLLRERRTGLAEARTRLGVGCTSIVANEGHYLALYTTLPYIAPGETAPSQFDPTSSSHKQR